MTRYTDIRFVEHRINYLFRRIICGHLVKRVMILNMVSSDDPTLEWQLDVLLEIVAKDFDFDLLV